MNIKKMVQILCLSLCSTAVNAGQTPVFSITPLTTLPRAVIAGQNVIVEYQITNNTANTLSNNGVALNAALEQVTDSTLSTSSAPICQKTFSLNSKASCTLVLRIVADAMKGPITAGPRVCSTQSNRINCSTPSAASSLNIKKLAEAEVDKQTIVLMRHGEKPSTDLGQLDCQGLNRALALPNVLNSQFGKPNYIFAPNPAGDNSGYSYVRPMMTIEPTAVQYGLTVNTAFTFTNYLAVAEELISNAYKQSLSYVTWEHVNLVDIAQSIFSLLGGDPNIVPPWPSNDFNSLYIITIAWYQGVPAVSFQLGTEDLNNLSTQCPSTTPFSATPPVLTETTIYFVPSGASTDIISGTSQLNCYGLNRALGLMSIFGNTIIPDYFYAPAPPLIQNPYNFDYLAEMVLEPTAIYQVQPFNTLFGYSDYQTMATHLLSSNLTNKGIAVAWDVGTLPDLMGSLGVSPVPTSINPDLIYQVTLGNPVYSTITGYTPSSSICPQPIPTT
jgi:hypothetical protein